MNLIKTILKLAVLPCCLTVLFNLLEYGWKWDQFYDFFYPIVLAVIFTVSLFNTRLRKTMLVISFTLFGVMIFLYLSGLIDLSNTVGSSGMAILIIVLFTYLPSFIKDGYIKKF